MTGYRLYILRPDGRIRTTLAVDGEDDAEAIRRVEAMTETAAMELWDRGRPVKTFSAVNQGEVPLRSAR